MNVKSSYPVVTITNIIHETSSGQNFLETRLIARDGVVLLIVVFFAAHINAQNTTLGHYSTAVSIRSEATMTRGWSTPAISNREAASPLSGGK